MSRRSQPGLNASIDNLINTAGICKLANRFARSAATVRLLFALFVLVPGGSCTYMKYASVQSDYARIQNAEPGQVNLKHMLDKETFFIQGRILDDAGRFSEMPKVVAAYSSQFRTNERVDTMYIGGVGEHFGLNLPAGQYDLLVLVDEDGDGVIRASEVAAHRQIVVDVSSAPEKVLSQVDFQLTEPVTVDWVTPIRLPGKQERPESLFYPSGSLRQLDDPLFDGNMSTLGLYDPASFLENAPTMFYALEEDLPYKVPVVFVHGIAGSAREFAPLVEKLDRNLYKPWFFYYPSGGDLDQLAAMFYEIYLSGKVVPLGEMPLVIVAHSMGGLIVREAINRYRGKPNENRLQLLITIATPFGGHEAAASGEKHGLIVLPSWRDLNPDSPFITNLYRKPLPEGVRHELLYAYRNESAIKLGENSDGVVALSSQLFPLAQQQSDEQFGFDSTHTDILRNGEAIAHIAGKIGSVQSFYPQAQLDLLVQGGYDVPLGDGYSPRTRYMIRSIGVYLMALTNGTLVPFHPEEQNFIDVVNGTRPPGNEYQTAWLKFLGEYPDLRDGQ